MNRTILRTSETFDEQNPVGVKVQSAIEADPVSAATSTIAKSATSATKGPATIVFEGEKEATGEYAFKSSGSNHSQDGRSFIMQSQRQQWTLTAVVGRTNIN